MTTPFVLTFRPGISVVDDPEQGAVLETPRSRLDLSHLSPSFLASLRQLSDGGATEAELTQMAMASGGFGELPKFHFFLTKFVRLGSICYSLYEADSSTERVASKRASSARVSSEPSPFAKLVPSARSVAFSPKSFAAVALDQGFRLSRFAYCRSDGGRMVLESPAAQATIELGDWRGGAIATALGQAQTGQALLEMIPMLKAETVQGFLSLLHSVGMVLAEDECESEAQRQWEFHDLLFHARSRQGRTQQVVGSTYRFREVEDSDSIAPLPVIRPQPQAWETVALPVPDLESLGDRPFTEVLESRRSIRTYNPEAPITLVQLGEFLYRSARMRQMFQMEKMNCSDRPYPGGGACYELELYIAVHNCEGLDQGLYHYCPEKHQLGRVRGWDGELEQLMSDASHATRKDESVPPQVLITVASRFARVAWKYESIAYALMLKNLGGLYQTMYLVATSMGLAPCALGAGNADLFAQLIGSEYYAETSIGEFTLGSAPADLADEPKLMMMEPVDWEA